MRPPILSVGKGRMFLNRCTRLVPGSKSGCSVGGGIRFRVGKAGSALVFTHYRVLFRSARAGHSVNGSNLRVITELCLLL
jgi:hypothetical protein